MSWLARSVAELHVCLCVMQFLPHYSEPFIVVASGGLTLQVCACAKQLRPRGMCQILSRTSIVPPPRMESEFKFP